MRHSTHLAYLIAEAMAKQSNVKQAYRQWRDNFDFQERKEILQLLFEQSINTKNYEVILDWLVIFVRHYCVDELIPEVQRQHDTIFASSLLEKIRSTQLVAYSDLTVDLHNHLCQAVASILDDKRQLLPSMKRAEAALLLGKLGDPRFPILVPEWRREIARALRGDNSGYLCRVEPGIYILGSNDSDIDARESEKPQHTVVIKTPFLISRYPITNIQWSEWLRHGEGITSQTTHANIDFPNQPIVGMRMSEINDFCKWLSNQVGRTMQLPSESQWEAAARGIDARLYPWGNNWQEDHAATQEEQPSLRWKGTIQLHTCSTEKQEDDIEMREDHTSDAIPVGCYPVGASPCGAMDMAGNVWELTTDVWESYKHANIPFLEPYYNVRRGGSYKDDKSKARCAARIGADKDYALGFRIISPRV